MAYDRKRKRFITDAEAKDLQLAEQIKPKLRQFVTTKQRERAAEAAKTQQQETERILNMPEVIQQASKIAAYFFFAMRGWEKLPPYLEMRWLKLGPQNEELQQEMQGDVAGFASYLVREYNNYLKYKALQRGYPNPMLETNLGFFWEKMQIDLKLLIEAEQRRVAAGNKSEILVNLRPSSPIVPSNGALKN